MLLNMVGNGWAMAKLALMCSGPESFTEFSRSSCCSSTWLSFGATYKLEGRHRPTESGLVRAGVNQ